jgi:hypothetical protein
MTAVTTLSEAKRNLLQSYLYAHTAQPGAAAPVIVATDPSEMAPLTISQEQLVLRESKRPDAPPLYNECIQLRMLGALNIPAVEKALSEIIRRHEIWRATYRVSRDQVSQVVHPEADQLEMPLVDLQEFSGEDLEQTIDDLIGSLAGRPFDLAKGPLLRARLIKVSHVEHRLYLIAHLSIVDGLSVYQIFPRELAALYRAYASGRSADLDPLPIQFGDYSRWQRQGAQIQTAFEKLDHWRNQLSGGIPILNWPTDRARPLRETFRGEIRKFILPTSLAQAMKLLVRMEGVTLFVVILSLLAAVMHAYTRQDDFAIGTPSPSGRKRSELQGLLGYFLTPVTLRFRLQSGVTFRELLRQAQRLTLEAISNDDLPVEVLARKLNLHTDSSRNPLFTVATSLQPAMVKFDLDWTVTSMDISSGGAPWDLYLAFIDGQQGMLGRIQYNPDLFETGTIDRFVQHYQELAQVVSINPDRPISEIALT